MKLLTLNCHSWQEENQIEKLKYLAKVIVKEGFDVIALQEVNQLADEKIVSGEIRENNFIYILCKELEKLGERYNFRWDYHHIGYDIYHEGTGILYKGEKLECYGDFIGTTTDTNFWKTRKFTMISKMIKGERVDFYSCHMGWWNDPDNPFEKQFDELLEFAENRGNRYFLMGDFNNNANVEKEGYEYMLNKGIYDTYSLAQNKDEGITVPGVIAGWEGKCALPKRIDFILTNEKIDLKASKVIFNGKNKEIISDHFGVVVEM